MPDTVLHKHPGDAARLLLKGLVMAKRAFDGDGGWFPRYDKGFGEVSEFRCALCGGI